MVTVPEIITAMAQVIATVPGISAAHYPAPKIIVAKKEAVLYWGGSGTETLISNDMSQRMWQPSVVAQILTPMQGNTPAEFADIETVITPIVDVFDTAPNHTLGGLVNRCQVVRVLSTLQVGYAGHDYYAAELHFSIKFHRRAGG